MKDGTRTRNGVKRMTGDGFDASSHVINKDRTDPHWVQPLRIDRPPRPHTGFI